jgi:hypothetical protein
MQHYINREHAGLIPAGWLTPDQAHELTGYSLYHKAGDKGEAELAWYLQNGQALRTP